MRAVTIDGFGATPAVTEVAKPEPGPGETLVKVHASSLNGFDGAVIYGVFKDMLEHKFPVTLGYRQKAPATLKLSILIQ